MSAPLTMDLPQVPLLAAALAAADRGWHVHPLRPGAKTPALHGEERCPRTGECAGGHRKWEQRATTDPTRIERCWTHAPYNVGIATGPAGLLVVDLDMPKDKDEKGAPDGANCFLALCERAGQPWPTTYTVRSARGGQHLYFAAPDGVRLHNTAGKLGALIDTRAWGGYVVAAGSTTATGDYHVVADAPVADLPAWLLAALTPPPRARGPVTLPSPGRAGAYAQAALRNETDSVRHAPEGTRNRTLVRAARALGRLVASGDLPHAVVEEALNGAGEAAGLTERECRPAVTSALNWSISHNGGTAA
ncbi:MULTISPECIES: bifunctional DNA primase/polymerase [Streptomyces]|uniref:Bifunctional DNA primase/polymerase n=2 Tax=Streptomyces rimosus subsp. rimosus TaxID=132474 RepID=L8EF88_STRR1|nr:MULTISPECIES: bifunctional DNA primase/polymerase [Streptomyces]KOG67408.1 DNA primase [Kitasatospora aureofaciens]MYT46724.1 DNA primase [Streptomyces sp. SID5471]KOT45694.1 DNA primase [Streptomyces rimosus subsp. rimosus]KOT46970.1 DNA primase [Streptomyces sp. NRRL WC-3701]KOT67131.1 DNA primase [Streptomyces rimosus subsp. rimosus]